MFIKLIKTDELAETLSITTKRVYEMVKQNKIPKYCIVKIGRNIRFDLEAIEMWLCENKLSNE